MSSSGTDCSPKQLTDLKNKERVHICSTVNSCYDFGAHAYSNDKCGITESCGTWRKKGDVLLQGCIRSEFCGVTAEYEKNPTEYKCPQGAKKLAKTRPETPQEPTPAGADDTPVSPGSAAAAGPDAQGRTPLFSYLGYSDLDIVDGLSGLAGGLMKTDEKVNFSQCYGGIPKIVEQTIGEVNNIDWKDLLNWSKDWEEVQDSWSFVQNIIKEVPEEVESCSMIVTDVIGWAVGLFGQISFTLLWTNLQSGMMTIMMGMMAKGTDVGVAFAAHDFYRLGQDVGGMVNVITDLGIAPDTA